jgi:hypothetical protein
MIQNYPPIVVSEEAANNSSLSRQGMLSPKSKSKISQATHKVNLGTPKDQMQIQIQISEKKRF